MSKNTDETKESKRLDSNLKILNGLIQIAKKYPQLRFHQLLQYCNIEDPNALDPFYVESVDTLNDFKEFLKKELLTDLISEGDEECQDK